jgi:hypothetical protein
MTFTPAETLAVRPTPMSTPFVIAATRRWGRLVDDGLDLISFREEPLR